MHFIHHFNSTVNFQLVEKEKLQTDKSMSEKTETFDYEKGEEAIKPSWRRRAEKFFDESTFNGALYIFASKSWPKRIFWLLIIVIAIGGFWAVTVADIIRLVREPIATSITLTRENELAFPAVTICSLSLLNTTTLESGGATVVNDLIDLFDFAETDLPECRRIANQIASNTGRNIGWGELTNLANNDLRVLLKECTYEGRKCGIEDFQPISTVAGRCYTFNRPTSNKPQRMVQGTGVRRGLRLQLSPEFQLFSLGNDHGFRIVVHNPDELPRPESEGIAVGLRSTVYIGMRQVDSVDKTKFSSGHQCRMDTTFNQELTFPDYTTYSQSSCLTECGYKFLADECGCIERRFYTPRDGSQYNQFRECTAPDLCCEVQNFESVGEVGEICDCPPRCTTVERTLTISSSTNEDDLVGVNVFYESLILETRETTDSYTPWSLISDIGGNTGLFLGFTLLSGVELFLLVLGLAKDFCCCSRKKQKS